MKTFYILLFIGIFSSCKSLPNVRIDHPVKFDLDNITVASTTKWDSSINITDLTDDDSNQLILYVHSHQSLSLPGDKELVFHIEKTIFENIHNNKTSYQISKNDSYVLPGSISVNAISTVGQSLETDINFTDISNTRSRISYTVTFWTGVNITWPAYNEKFREEIDNIKYPELDFPKIPDWKLNNDSSIPLVNATGFDQSVCILTKCNSTEDKSYDVITWYINDDVAVTESRDIQNKILRSVSPPNKDGFLLFSVYHFITVTYEMIIGLHQC